MTELVPTVALGPTLNVNVLDDVVGFVPKDAVTPLGSPDTLSATLPANPPYEFTKTLTVPLLF